MKTPDLFENKTNSYAPLAEKMRPKKLSDLVGQKHLLGKGMPLRTIIEKGKVSSIILWGPPGSGKTSIAQLVATYTKSHFEQFSAVSAGVSDIRRIIKEADERLKFNSRRTILFLDEIHRFNKAQQDAFLPYVENGTIILIGATTENPSFEINAPLISRSRIFVLNPLEEKDIKMLVSRASDKYPRLKIDKNAVDYLAKSANGDARNALNALEMAISLIGNSKVIDLKTIESAVQQKAIYYDKKGDSHYNVISAFIKSMRGNNPDAALHYLSRMIKAGEDPVFIARRMVIFSSEDVGNAQPTAVVLATSTMQAVHLVGMPEAGILLSQCATYLATAPKSRASYNGLIAAMSDIDENELEPVPIELRNATTNLMKDLGYGKNYKWTDDKKFQEKIEFMPQKLKGKKYYFSPKKD